jgi:hypothetical protein
MLSGDSREEVTEGGQAKPAVVVLQALFVAAVFVLVRPLYQLFAARQHTEISDEDREDGKMHS